MSPTMPAYTLYELVATPGDVVGFSPHVWKTKLDLA